MPGLGILPFVNVAFLLSVVGSCNLERRVRPDDDARQTFEESIFVIGLQNIHMYFNIHTLLSIVKNTKFLGKRWDIGETTLKRQWLD